MHFLKIIIHFEREAGLIENDEKLSGEQKVSEVRAEKERIAAPDGSRIGLSTEVQNHLGHKHHKL